MSLNLFNSLTRQKEPFTPDDPNRVTMYVCGPTVYNFAHIGNARPAVAFDVLFRVLRHVYGADAVIYARNITDIDDKIIQSAVASGESIATLTKKFGAIYNEDMTALGVLPPTIEPWATGHVDGMIKMIGQLVEKNHAYATPTGVYFHVPSIEDYGTLSRRSQDDNQAGARVAVDSDKRDPADFALWKSAHDTDPADAVWDSPWGKGRPGWHIECSAMAAEYLGETIDIHAGGIDLQFPHHENEIAQSEGCHGAPMARVWLHNGFLNIDGKKMAKSDGNTKLVHELLKTYDGEVMRFALLSGHYRTELDWTADLLAQAKTTLDRYYAALGRVWAHDAAPTPRLNRVLTPLLDDLNTPRALARLAEMANHTNIAADANDGAAMAQSKADMLAAGGILGLLSQTPEAWQKGGDVDENTRIDGLISARIAARTAKDWAEADRLRDALAAEGIEIMDKDGKTSWRRA